MAKGITIKNNSGNTIYYPKTISDLVYDNNSGETIKKQLDPLYILNHKAEKINITDSMLLPKYLNNSLVLSSDSYKHAEIDIPEGAKYVYGYTWFVGNYMKSGTYLGGFMDASGTIITTSAEYKTYKINTPIVIPSNAKKFILNLGDIASSKINDVYFLYDEYPLTDNINNTISLHDLKVATSAVKPYTDDPIANKRIKKLFLDISGYNGSTPISKDSLYITNIATVSNATGFQINTNPDQGASSKLFTYFPSKTGNSVFEGTSSNGIYFYVILDFTDCLDNQSNYCYGKLNPICFDPTEDPRNIRKIETNNIKDGAVSTAKVADKAITNAKIADGTITKDKLGFTIEGGGSGVHVDFGKYKNIFNYDGLIETGGTNVMPNNNGGATVPAVYRKEGVSNPFGLKYCTILSPVDMLYKGQYYSNPFITFNITNILQDRTKFTLGFWYNGSILPKEQVFITVGNQANQGFGEIIISQAEEGTKTKDIANFLGKLTYKTYPYKGENWVFVQVQVSSKIVNPSPIQFLLNCIGGSAENVGKEYPFCNFTLINDIVELDAFTYYPTKENMLYELQQGAHIDDGSITEAKLSSEVQEKLNREVGGTTIFTPTYNGILATAGDSITFGAATHSDPSAIIPTSDPFYPKGGTSGGNQATYGYFIAKSNNMQWYNYGQSGSCLGNVKCRNSYKNGFSDTRYMNMADDLTHITLLFGWNDVSYGYEMHIEEWIEATYGTRKAWTDDSTKFDTLCSGNLYYCSATENAAVKAKTGSINGNSYTGVAYFKAAYIGSPTDTTNKTWWGAYNIVLPYLKKKYPLAKILVITGYGGNNDYYDASIAAAKKWNVPYLDLSAPETRFLHRRDTSDSRGMIRWEPSKFTDRTKWNKDYPEEDITTYDWNIRVYTLDRTHPNIYGYKFMYPIIMNKLNSI